MMETELTHKGWLGICPIYIGDLDTDCPTVIERHWTFVPLFNLSLWIYGGLFWLLSYVAPNYDPAWPVMITGEVEKGNAS